VAARPRRGAIDPRRRGSILSALLLDTTFLIDVERGAASLDDAIGDDDDVAIAAVTVAELRVGVHLADGRRATQRSAFVDAVASGIPVLGYDAAVAEVHAGLLAHARRQGRPRGAHDLIIAATASAAERAVLTADPSGFDDLPGVVVLHHR
jgi:tRNA(fMet)-specific endonuclease VapC